MRRQYWWRYQTDEEFRQAEAARKARWYYEHRDKILARARKRRRKRMVPA